MRWRATCLVFGLLLCVPPAQGVAAGASDHPTAVASKKKKRLTKARAERAVKNYLENSSRITGVKYGPIQYPYIACRVLSRTYAKCSWEGEDTFDQTRYSGTARVRQYEFGLDVTARATDVVG